MYCLDVLCAWQYAQLLRKPCASCACRNATKPRFSIVLESPGIRLEQAKPWFDAPAQKRPARAHGQGRLAPPRQAGTCSFRNLTDGAPGEIDHMVNRRESAGAAKTGARVISV
ncbi:MAG: hypothetical protein IH606_23830 [Burkholderiales bacterium]|nr:hypothetical protein [Burkholderiales bacterium]